MLRCNVRLGRLLSATGPASGLRATALMATGALPVCRHLSAMAHHKEEDASEVSAETYREQHKITLHGSLGGLDTSPATSFAGIERIDATEGLQSLPRSVLSYFDRKGYTEPSAIQAQSLPISLAGRDVIAVAQTGSGKTLGFLLPLFWSVDRIRSRGGASGGPLAVVLAPTRELAQQIEKEANEVGKAFGCTTVCVFGGQAKHLQERRISQLRRRLDLVVATPGRLCDLIRDRVLPMHNVQFLVLDEADRMLDMGFEPQLREIAEEIPPPAPTEEGAAAAAEGGGRQTLMFSATWPKEVRELASEFMNRQAVRISIGGEDKLVANRDIVQTVQLHANSLSKLEALGSLVEDMDHEARAGEGGCHTVVFVNRKRDADMVAADIRDNTRVRAASLHGDLSQSRRDSVLNAARQGRTSVLVATDVAARGLDVKTVRRVVNFDMPTNMEDYVHRIGRTGRAGRTGEAVSFLNPSTDEALVKHLVRVLREHAQLIPDDLEELHTRLAPRKFEPPSFRGRGGRGFASSHGAPRQGKCHICGEPGHWANECRNKERGGYGSRYGGRGGSGYGGGGGGRPSSLRYDSDRSDRDGGGRGGDRHGGARGGYSSRGRGRGGFDDDGDFGDGYPGRSRKGRSGGGGSHTGSVWDD